MEVLRLYELEHAPDVVNLFNEYRVYFGQSSDPIEAEMFLNERLKNKESIILIVKQNEKVIGFTQLYPAFSSLSLKPIGILNDLYVLESHRNSGAGKSLLDAAFDLGKSLYWKGMILETSPVNPARRLYERAGWTLENEFLHYGFNY